MGLVSNVDYGRRVPTISGPVAEFTLADVDGATGFVAVVEIADVRLADWDSSYDYVAHTARGAVLGVMTMRMAGSLCAIGWPG